VFRSMRKLMMGLALVAAFLAVGSPASAEDIHSSGPWFNVHSNLCLGVQGGNMTNGTRIIQWPCNDHPDQNWNIAVPEELNLQLIRNGQDSNKCLAVAGNSDDKGAALIIWDCNSTPGQLWRQAYHPASGCYVWYNEETQYAMSVDSGRVDQGAPINQWPAPNQNQAAQNQIWC